MRLCRFFMAKRINVKILRMCELFPIDFSPEVQYNLAVEKNSRVGGSMIRRKEIIMGKIKNIISIIASAAVTVSACAAMAFPSAAEERTMNIDIDFNNASLAENTRYKGFGLISANNSSRLLLDYKYEQPEKYNEILGYLFGDDGLNISHIKIEMGADVNSSSGTEPAVMRAENEKADVTRGAGFQLAADAKKIDPDITLDMLWWSEPRWVTDSGDVYAARYKWYRETLVSAYETYGLEFDYVSATRNERTIDADWTVYLSEHLKSDTGTPYDFSKIKIVDGEAVGTWAISKMMLAEEKFPGLLDAVDVVGSHYTDWSDENTRKLQREYGKEVWFSEASSPMSYARGVYKYDGNGSGLSGINGTLDIANRIITMYPGGGMTMYEFQPAVASYYDGVTYFPKQLILANEPWSGYYLLDSGFYMGLHFSRFIKTGWAFIDGACAGDGKAGGDGHAIVDATYSYMTCGDPDTGDYSTVITNTTDTPVVYKFNVSNTVKAGSPVNVWETKGPGGGAWNENYFRHRETIVPEPGSTYRVTVQPYSMVTVTTLDTERGEFAEYESRLLELPYSDDFEYPDEYLSARGGAPRYTTDEGGAFEVVKLEDGSKVLMQKITEDIKAEEWGSTPSPVTNFGDDRWFNYSVSADVKFASADDPSKNSTAVGLRYNLGDSGASGWRMQLSENGEWRLRLGSRPVMTGETALTEDWNTIKIEAVGNTIRGYINGEQVAETTADTEGYAMQPAGRAALYSSYYNNCFDNVKVEPVVGENIYISRLDSTDDGITFEGDWSHSTMDSFKNYKRTASLGEAGASFTVDFEGTGIILVGVENEGTLIDIELDGKVTDSGYAVPKTSNRQSFWNIYGLENGHHTLKVTVKEGSLMFDSAEVLLDNEDAAKLFASVQAGKPEVPVPTLTSAEEVTVQPEEGEASAESIQPDNTPSAAGETGDNGKMPVIPIAVGVGAAAVTAGIIAAVIKAKKKK